MSINKIQLNGNEYQFTDPELEDAVKTLGTIENQAGFLRAYVDSDGHILWGIREDGSIEHYIGVPSSIQEEINRLESDYTSRLNQLQEDIETEIFTDLTEQTLDISTRLQSKVDKETGKSLISTEYIIETDYPDFIKACVDQNNKLLFGVRTDGSFEFSSGVPTPIQEFIKNEFDAFSVTFSELINTINTYIDDTEERIQLTLDSSSHVVSYRRMDGTLYENNINVIQTITANHGSFETISMNPTIATDIEIALKENGFMVNSPIDWSEHSLIELPIPRQCAKVNIISETGLATTKTQDKQGYLQYWDKDGNYFKKPIIFNAQGSSSMGYIEKNQSIDFTDCEIKFGNWVVQDSFHFKCYYIDVFRGIANIAYNYVEEIIKYKKCRSNRFHMYPTGTDTKSGSGNFSKDFGDNALCHPDGFPIEVYVNGEYYGLFAWNLKKHRKNYSMNKKDATSTLLDGVITWGTFFGGSIDWTQFELRNPKDLCTMDGAEYDADTNCNELIDSTSDVYDETNTAHTNSNTIKAILQECSAVLPQIKAETDIDAAKTLFEQWFDKDMTIVYEIISNVISNFDGYAKNWQWTIYNKVMAPNFYDLDSIFGRHWRGTHILYDVTTMFGTSTSLPTGQALRLYKDEFDTVYKELRDNGMISVDYIMNFVYDWIDRVGIDAIERNIDKWTPPSYRNPNVNTEYWICQGVIDSTEIDYDAETTYNVDDICYYGKTIAYKFKCIKSCVGQAPFTKFYAAYPFEYGMFDSPERVKLYITERIAYLDSYFNYITE